MIVLQACSLGKNALLESPTGTGKTLCLLTATLAWLQKARQSHEYPDSALPRIIYSSRTHSQLNQVLSELKHTVYLPKTCLIGSRDQLCVHPEIQKHRGMALNGQCKKLRASARPQVKGSGCQFFKNVKDSVIPNGAKWETQDIEDLHKMGRVHSVCPYYLQKNRVQFADLVLMPYNYLLDPKIRENFKVNYENAVVIIDEAHNVEHVSEQVASFEISIHQFGCILRELTDLLQMATD